MLPLVKSTTFIVALAFVSSLTGCGKSEPEPAAKPPEVVFKKAESTKSPDAAKKPDEDLVSGAEATRRDMAKKIVAAFAKAKNTDQKLEILDKLTRGTLKSPELVAPLTPLLKDSDADVRAYAIKARAMVSPTDALTDVLASMKDEEVSVRQSAAEAFGVLEPVPMDVLFMQLGKEREAQVQQALLMVLPKKGGPAEAAKLVAMIKDLDIHAAPSAIDFLAKFPDQAKPHADTLAWYLDRDDVSARLAVARLLGEWKIKSKPSLMALARCLNDNELPVRKAAFEALKALSNDDFDFNPEGSEESRKESVAKAKEWVASLDGK